MTFSLEIGSLDTFGESMMAWAEALRFPVQRDMAYRLQDITQNNFGMDGEDRPTPWQKLSPRYAAVAHGGDTIPTEILSGDLHDSIQVEEGNPEFSRVFTDVQYAAEQQFGGGDWNVPPRPFFPIVSTLGGMTLTEYTEREVRDAAVEAIASLVNK